MSGCYGNDPEDKYFENKLNEYLDERQDRTTDEEEQAYWEEQKQQSIIDDQLTGDSK
jgi:hypothetical protein